MSNDDSKVSQLIKEMEVISQRLNYCKEQLKSLGTKTQMPDVQPVVAVQLPVTPTTQREHPSHQTKVKEQEGLEKFIGLRVLQYSGIIALVIGISIGVKFAIDKDLITPAARLILAYLAGISLYVLSTRLKAKYVLFSAILLSGAMATLYFTSFAAFAYYEIINSGVAFILMLIITAFTIYSAIRYDREVIAILGMVGAYAIPFLVSVNSERTELFFTYIISINIGIAILAFKKSWMIMTGLALFISWTLFFGWAFTRYKENELGLGIVVLAVLNILFSFTTIGYAAHKKRLIQFGELCQFLFNNIFTYLAAVVLFYAFHDKALTDVTGFAFLFFVLQAIGVRLFLPAEKLLLHSLIAFSLIALIFYFDLKWNGMFVTMGWIVSAVATFILGVFGKINWLRLTAVIVTISALGKLILVDRVLLTAGQKIISYIVIGTWMLVLSYLYQRFRKQLLDPNKA